VQCPVYCGQLANNVSRTVRCKGTLNGVVVVIADSYCDASSKPSSIVSCPATAPCAPFWYTSGAQCPIYCGLVESNVSQIVSCRGIVNNVAVDVADSFCDASTKPSTVVACPATVPCAPQWVTSDVQCPIYCGLLASTQPRTVQCKGTVNGEVIVIADTYCDASTKPSDSVNCPATAPCAPSWNTSEVHCPDYCGQLASDVPRVVKCEGTVNGVVVDVADSYCDASTKPSTTVSCPATVPCGDLYWSAGDVQCPTYCGAQQSSQTRTIQCNGVVGELTVIADSFCDASTRPAASVNCPATMPCAPTWHANDVQCGTYCGLLASDVQRTVTCQGTVNNAVVDIADSYCDASTKPSIVVTCPATLPCAPQWFASDVQCPTDCGLPESEQSRTVQCKGTVNSVVVVIADTYCDASTKPSDTVNCPTTAPCGPFWCTSDVQCPDYCGVLASNVSRTVSCKGIVNSTAVDIAESYCDASTMPSTIVTCPATALCAPHWSTSDVQCPTDCGLLATTQSRNVQCKATVNNEMVVVADSDCDASSRPSDTVSCSATAPCAPFWYTSDVQCPYSCGLLESTQPRTVSCQGAINNTVVNIADSYCDATTMPTMNVTCPATAPCAPYWTSSNAQCPTDCGLSASTQTISVQCSGIVNHGLSVVADSYCDASSKPSDTLSCAATPPCAPTGTWQISDVQCPIYCGLLAGNLSRTVTCQGLCDLSTKPSTIVSCPATAPCAPFWDTGDVQCPTACGLVLSYLPRTVTCKGTINDVVQTVADSYCPVPKPPSSLSCPATASCVYYQWSLNASCPQDCGRSNSSITCTIVCVSKSPSNTAGTPVADSYCAADSKPNPILLCPATPPCGPFWFEGPVNCPTTCGQDNSTITRAVECRGTVEGQGETVADTYCDSNTKPSATLNCPATDPCCGAVNVSCSTDDDCCSGMCYFENYKGTCGCQLGPVDCASDAQCCSGTCKNATCVPASSWVGADGSSANPIATGVALGLGLGLGGAVAVAVVIASYIRRRRSKRGRENAEASEPLTPRVVATPRRVDVVA
jgi:hypothetical protein